MALGDDIREAREELIALDGEIKGIGQDIQDGIVYQMEALNETTQKVAQSFSNDLGKAINKANSNLDNQNKIQNKILKGQDASKDIEREISKVQKERSTILRKIEGLKRAGVAFNAEEVLLLEESLNSQETQLETLNDINTAQIANRGITGNILTTAKEYLTSLDKSGLAAKILGGELTAVQSVMLLAEASMLAIAKGALTGSDNIANLQKNLGISYASAYELQNSLALTTASSGKLFVTSKDLNKAFTDLASTTGFIADFGGDTLVTMTALTKQLGLGVKEASQLALLARTQSTDTESVLDNTVETVNAINRQNGVAISAKEVLNDIATASKSIVVSLGMSPEILAEAATEARALGLNLETVDKIAGSILDFESSIAAELQAELLTGKEINLEKARLAALNNDTATLTKEIGENEAIISSFATGNRIQQEASAAALGLSREELAGMVYQQELQRIGAEGVRDVYGEQAYQQMQAQSASEKFASTLEKVQGIIGDIGTVFAPILDTIASFIGGLAESKAGAAALVGVMATLASLSIASAISNMVASLSLLGPAGIPLGIAATAGLLATIASAKSSVTKTQSVQDGIAPPGNGPFTITDAYGATAITAKGDGLAVSPNINSGGDKSQERTNMLLEKLIAKDTNINMDGRRLNDSMKSSAVSYNVGT